MENFLVAVAVVAMGEMGSNVARRLVDRGASVFTSPVGRSAASLARASSAGVTLADDAHLIAQVDLFLSIVPPSAAAATAQRFLPVIEQSPNKPMFIDCNAIAPQTLLAIAAPFLERGLPFGDASIIGTPPRPDGYSPRFYMSGKIDVEAETLNAAGIETRVISQNAGDASALKMAYAGITKGFQALGAAMALGAARAGAAESFVAELQDSQPVLYGWLCKMLPSAPAKAYRWDDEMLEISKFLEPERGAADMLLGAASLYRHVAEANQAGPHSEILFTLQKFVSRQT